MDNLFIFLQLWIVLTISMNFKCSSSTRQRWDFSLWWKSSHSSHWSVWRYDPPDYFISIFSIPPQFSSLNLSTFCLSWQHVISLTWSHITFLYVSFCPAKANPPTLSRRTQGSLLPAGGLHLLKEPQFPGGTVVCPQSVPDWIYGRSGNKSQECGCRCWF